MPCFLAVPLLLVLLLAPGPLAADAPPQVNGDLLPEGSPWDAPGATVIPDVLSSLTTDLGRPVAIRALLVQADGDDIYFVEASPDAQSWEILWRVPAVPAPPGLRTRTTVLGAPVTARFVRARPTSGDGRFSVSRLRVYPTVPDPWPPPLDLSLPNSRLPAFPALTPAIVNRLQAALATLGLLAVFWSLVAGSSPEHGRLRRAFLGAVTLLSVLGWWNFGNFRFTGYLHRWELYHYYLGARYFGELGYDGLYQCSAVADVEDGLVAEVRDRRIRDLTTNQIGATDEVLAHPERCTSRFSPDRWDSFRQDNRFFRAEMGILAWTNAQMDHGFNATPVWTLTGRWIANLRPAGRSWVSLLASIDVLLLLAMGLLVFRSFGFEATCAAALFWSLNSFSRFAWTGGAYLRYDWLFCAVAGIAALKTGRRGLAGFALTWAALLRIFPACLIAGVGLKALAEVVGARSLRPLLAYRRFALGCALALALLVPASTASLGARAWSGFLDNSRKHLATEADNLVGLRVALAHRPGLTEALGFDPLRPDTYAAWNQGQAEADRSMRPLFRVLVLGFLVLLATGTRGREDWVAAALGAGLLPVALRMANYYQGLLLVFGLLWERSPAIGLGLVAVAWASGILSDLFVQLDERSFWHSLLIVGYVVAATARLARGQSLSATSDAESRNS